ncbi:major facilitator superfamily domain-containing protein [Nemania sp. FL0031]|nr:major facilitator superfamily domain-containing protein [Nemania sp. FL0031]
MGDHCEGKVHIFDGSGANLNSQSLHSSSAGGAVASFPINDVNISFALTLGLPDELDLTGSQPNLSTCVLVFGLVTIGQGFVQNYSSLLATRFLLGLAEAGIFPGSFYLISFWYKQEEAHKRFTVYWSSTIVAGAFGGLLSSAISNLGRTRGLSSWRWVFILEGIVTVLVGVVAFYSISDFPREASWLSESEREFLLKKTESDEPHTVPITSTDIKVFLPKATNWLGAFMYFCLIALLVSAYSVSYFVPSIVKDLGYNTIQTQLHSVPPFTAALGFTILSAYLSDRLRIRSPFIFLALALLITGLAILLTVHGTKNFSAEYAAIVLTTMGSIGIGGHVVCWYVMNLQGHVERSIGSAFMICFGGFGGIVATFAFLKQDSPYYHTGYSINIATASLCVVVHIAYGLLVWRQKKATARNRGDTAGHTFEGWMTE